MRDTATSGRRNARVEWQENVPVTADDGQERASWNARFTRWVSLIPRGGSERWLFEQVRAEIDHVIHADWDSTLATISPATWRIRYGSRLMNVDSVFDPDGNRKSLRIFATEVLA
jgi:head-tail adaptor